MTSTPARTKETLLRKTFVAGALFMVSMQTFQTGYYMVMQYQTNPNFSAFVWWFVGFGILLLLTAIVYLSRRNRRLTLDTVFETALVVSSVSFLSLSVTWLTMMLPLPFYPMGGDAGIALLNTLDQALPFMIILPLLVIILRRLRATKQW